MRVRHPSREIYAVGIYNKIEGTETEGSKSQNPAGVVHILGSICVERLGRNSCVVFWNISYHVRDCCMAKLLVSVKELTFLLLAYQTTPPIQHSITHESLFHSVVILTLKFYWMWLLSPLSLTHCLQRT